MAFVVPFPLMEGYLCGKGANLVVVGCESGNVFASPPSPPLS